MKPRMFIWKNTTCKKHFNRKNWVLQGHFNLWQSLVMKTSLGIILSFCLFIHLFTILKLLLYLFVYLFYRAWFVLMETSFGRTPSMPWHLETQDSWWTLYSNWPKEWTIFDFLMPKLDFSVQLSSSHQVRTTLFKAN